MLKVSGLTFLLTIELIVILVGLGVFLFVKNKKLSESSEVLKKSNDKKSKEDEQMKTEETPNKVVENADVKTKGATPATNTGAQTKTDATTMIGEIIKSQGTAVSETAKKESSPSTTGINNEINIDALLDTDDKDSSDTNMKETPASESEAIGGTPEQNLIGAIKVDDEVKLKEEVPVSTEETSNMSEKNDEVNIEDLLEEAQTDTTAEKTEETMDIIEEVEEINGPIEEDTDVQAKEVIEPATVSNEATKSENTETISEIEEVKEVFNATSDPIRAEIKNPTNNSEVTSIDVKDFKSLLTERESERQQLKNKVKELEGALAKKTQELNQKIKEYKSFKENEKELLALYKELKESSLHNK